LLIFDQTLQNLSRTQNIYKLVETANSTN